MTLKHSGFPRNSVFLKWFKINRNRSNLLYDDRKFVIKSWFCSVWIIGKNHYFIGDPRPVALFRPDRCSRRRFSIKKGVLKNFENMPPDEGGPGGPCLLTLFQKSYFARNVFLEIRFCIILQGIQNFFGPGTLGISSGALVKFTGKHLCQGLF